MELPFFYLDLQHFEAHLAQVEVGWDTDRLIRHAGEPKSKEQDVWYYPSREGDRGCVRYSSFHFEIREGKIHHIEKYGGFQHLEPADGGDPWE